MSTIALKYPKTGGDGANPPLPGGGGDGRGGSGSPNYGARLRRARLGLAVGLTPIAMLFVSFTSAYIVRQGLPTLDERTQTYVRDWLSVSLPVGLLLVNTLILIVSSITMELAMRNPGATSAARSLVITNTGTAPLTFPAITASAAGLVYCVKVSTSGVVGGTYARRL